MSNKEKIEKESKEFELRLYDLLHEKIRLRRVFRECELINDEINEINETEEFLNDLNKGIMQKDIIEIRRKVALNIKKKEIEDIKKCLKKKR